MDHCFVDQSAIAIRERAGFSFARRAEQRIRRRLFGQKNPAYSIVKRIYGIPDTADGLESVSVSTPNGVRQLFFRRGTSDENVIRDIFDSKQYGLEKLSRWPAISELLAQHHRAGRRPLIVDAGANIGISAVFFATTFPTSTVIAIEPEESNYRLLRENTCGLDVTCVRGALASTTGEIEVFDPGDGPWAFRTRLVERGQALPCTTIASIYAKHLDRFSFPFLVKIDIEGAEEDVFTRDTAWVRDTAIVVVELHDWMLPGKGSALPFLRCVGALDRDFIYSGENVFSIDNAALRDAPLSPIPAGNGP